MTHEESVSIIKGQFVKISKNVLTTALYSWAPIFKVPPLSTITNIILNKILNLIADNAETGAFFIYIDFNVDKQGRGFMAAAINNHNVQLVGTDEEKRNSEKILIDSFRALIMFRN